MSRDHTQRISRRSLLSAALSAIPALALGGLPADEPSDARPTPRKTTPTTGDRALQICGKMLVRNVLERMLSAYPTAGSPA